MSDGNETKHELSHLRNSAEAERLLKQFRKDGSPAATDDYRARYEFTFALLEHQDRALAYLKEHPGASMREALDATRESR